MKYVLKKDAAAAKRAVNFESCGNIHRSGSVRGMIALYGWRPGGQVRLGSYIYNIGPNAVGRLAQLHLLRG